MGQRHLDADARHGQPRRRLAPWLRGLPRRLFPRNFHGRILSRRYDRKRFNRKRLDSDGLGEKRRSEKGHLAG
ncbi:hypothetical protein Acsp02_33410 [Actinoplanes sp. NBRC 103695]|nr:hypothetical protein Acsp02_33410 [Actinoplanes sp. NBRC 103695]